jgi:hypothetical protein
VIWWDLATKDFDEKMHLSASVNKKKEQWWEQQCLKHGTTLAALQSRLSDAAAANVLPPAPIWLVDLELTCSFINCEHVHGKKQQLTAQEQFHQQEAANQRPLSGTSFIIWGKLADLFNKSSTYDCSRERKSWKLKPAMQPAVRQDLTEQDPEGEAAPAAAAAATAAAAAAAAVAAVPGAADNDNVLEEQQRMEIDGEEPARAAIGHQPRLRRARANKRAPGPAVSSDDDDSSDQSSFQCSENEEEEEDEEGEAEEDEGMNEEAEEPRTSKRASTRGAAASSCSPAATRSTQAARNSKRPRKQRRK